MKKTLHQSYLSRTTSKYRNQHPREEGIIATLSDIVERETSFENLPKALPKLHEFHKMAIDKLQVKNDEELERTATLMTVCLSMLIIDKHIFNHAAKNGIIND